MYESHFIYMGSILELRKCSHVETDILLYNIYNEYDFWRGLWSYAISYCFPIRLLLYTSTVEIGILSIIIGVTKIKFVTIIHSDIVDNRLFFPFFEIRAKPTKNCAGYKKLRSKKITFSLVGRRRMCYNIGIHIIP